MVVKENKIKEIDIFIHYIILSTHNNTGDLTLKNQFIFIIMIFVNKYKYV